jgi:hypothetical protein
MPPSRSRRGPTKIVRYLSANRAPAAVSTSEPCGVVGCLGLPSTRFDWQMPDNGRVFAYLCRRHLEQMRRGQH